MGELAHNCRRVLAVAASAVAFSAMPQEVPADVDGAVRGSFNNLQSYFETMRRQHWPEHNLEMYDLMPLYPQKTLEGENESEKLQRRQLMHELLEVWYQRHPGDAQRGLGHGVAQRWYEVFDNAFKRGGLSVPEGITHSFAHLNRRNDKDGPWPDMVSVGVNANIYQGSGQGSEQGCTASDRPKQLRRFVVALHEFIHGVDWLDGLSDVILLGREAAPQARNYDESLADGWTTLMAVRLLGQEGVAEMKAVMTDRLDADTGSDHYTVPTIAAALNWANKNQTQLANATPVDIYAIAVGLAADNALTHAEYAYLRDYKEGLQNWDNPQQASLRQSTLPAMAHPVLRAYEKNVQDMLGWRESNKLKAAQLAESASIQCLANRSGSVAAMQP